jgi:hypothetical protein
MPSLPSYPAVVPKTEWARFAEARDVRAGGADPLCPRPLPVQDVNYTFLDESLGGSFWIRELSEVKK